ncbi:MAG: tRNA pseudouridine(38-40) synthase TruA [Rhizobiales bacterium]|nr:tRNA pseudouridine(38-40) synthase TruA [Hyphomicrobiales bacterium]
MFRYKITIEYDGTPYVGWQIQDNGLSVQEVLSTALKNLTGEEFVPKGSGRTDAGVHALGQVAHIDLSKEWNLSKIRDGLNYHLRPAPIAITKAEVVDDEFDARFSAIRRHYRYVIVNRRARLTIDRAYAWQVPRPLNHELMNEAAQSFVGYHDFTTFRSTHCQAKSPLKTIDTVSVLREGEKVIIECSARSFMHNQVRSMVGSLAEVGMGKWPVSGIQFAIDAKDRAACGPVAPAHGLYFLKVEY